MDKYTNEIHNYLEKLQIPETEKKKLEDFLGKCNLKLRKAIQDKIIDVIDEIEENLDTDIAEDTQEFAKIITEDIFTYYY